MSLDFYLSEMSVSDRHGGGLTLQRVLGADLEKVGVFVHTSRFATQLPVSKQFANRCIDVPMWTESPFVRRLVGYRQAQWLSQRPKILRAHGRRIATKISAALAQSGAPLRGLICPQGAASLYAVEALSNRRTVEYATWIMDDHLIRWNEGKWQYPAHAEAVFARHLQKASAVFVISPAMGELYRERFGVDCHVLFGSSDPAGEPEWETANSSGRVRLGYFGTVSRWQKDALSLLAESLEPAGAELDIYTADEFLPESLDRPGVKLRGRIAPAEIAATMRNYDAVVLPASFEASLRNMSALNIATKMSECLASGTVTLFIGPAYAAMARFLKDTGAALIVTDRDAPAIVDTVAELRNRNRRAEILRSARSLVRSQVTTTVMRERWAKGCSFC